MRQGPVQKLQSTLTRSQARFLPFGRPQARFDFIAVLCLLGLAGCGGQQVSPQAGGSQSANASGAIVTAIAAGTLWVAGGGCRLQGCPYGSFCNEKSGYCDVRACEKGCPEGTVCNEGLGRCQEPGPPQTPNDFLPQDNKANLPPGTPH